MILSPSPPSSTPCETLNLFNRSLTCVAASLGQAPMVVVVLEEGLLKVLERWAEPLEEGLE